MMQPVQTNVEIGESETNTDDCAVQRASQQTTDFLNDVALLRTVGCASPLVQAGTLPYAGIRSHTLV